MRTFIRLSLASVLAYAVVGLYLTIAMILVGVASRDAIPNLQRIATFIFLSSLLLLVIAVFLLWRHNSRQKDVSPYLRALWAKILIRNPIAGSIAYYLLRVSKLDFSVRNLLLRNETIKLSYIVHVRSSILFVVYFIFNIFLLSQHHLIPLLIYILLIWMFIDFLIVVYLTIAVLIDAMLRAEVDVEEEDLIALINPLALGAMKNYYRKYLTGLQS